MVVSRQDLGLKEVIFVSGLPQNNARPITRRVAELPSLRYGTVGAKTTGTGPLRVSSTSNFTDLSNKGKKSNGFSSHINTGDYKPRRPPRRVRFTLPYTDGDVDAVGGVVDFGVAVKATAGDGWLVRTRAPSTTFSSSSESVARWYPHHHHHPHHRVVTDDRIDLQIPHGRRAKSSGKRAIEFNFLNNSRSEVGVSVTASPGARHRIHPTGRYIRGTLSPTANASPQAAASPGGQALLRAARDGDDHILRDLLRRATLVGIADADLNAVDSTGRTVLSYVASNGSIDLLDQLLQLPTLDFNKPDNEGNTPLHFAAQAGQVECLNCMVMQCKGIEIDARNNLGFTPLMKAALQGRNKCAKLLLFAGANPTLRDNGRGFRADQWARFCGRYVCADVIEKHARQRLLEKSTSYGNWGGENEIGARVLKGKVVPVPPMRQQPPNGFKSKLRKVFNSSAGANGRAAADAYSSARLVTQLTSAALCASSPVLPSGPNVPPVVKSLIRPLTVPRLHITLANNNSGGGEHLNNNVTNGTAKVPPPSPPITPQKSAVTSVETTAKKVPAIKSPIIRLKKKK